MEIWKAVVMGFIQGVAEFLPISSSGHLALMKHILHIDLESGGLLFDIMLHLGTLIAIFIAFWKDIKKIIGDGLGIIADVVINAIRFILNLGSKQKKEYKKVMNNAYRRFVLLVIVSTIPTGIIGVLLEDTIDYAASTILIPGIGLVTTAILLTVADRVKVGMKRANQTDYSDAVVIGLAQGVATLPGISRSGATITACLLCGLDKNYAVKYSFIMSIPAVLGAVVLKLKDFSVVPLQTNDVIAYIIGTIIAGLVGYICIKTMLVIVRGKKFKYFSYYCFIIGVIAIGWNFIK